MKSFFKRFFNLSVGLLILQAVICSCEQPDGETSVLVNDDNSRFAAVISERLGNLVGHTYSSTGAWGTESREYNLDGSVFQYKDIFTDSDNSETEKAVGTAIAIRYYPDNNTNIVLFKMSKHYNCKDKDLPCYLPVLIVNHGDSIEESAYFSGTYGQDDCVTCFKTRKEALNHMYRDDGHEMSSTLNKSKSANLAFNVFTLVK